MPLTDDYRRLSLDHILVDRSSRQRQDLEIDNAMLESIRRNGVINPVIVDSREDGFWLVAGERRLEASRQLGLSDIPVRLLCDLDSIELKILELEENAKRKDISWQVGAKAVADIHALYLERDPEWTQAETCLALALSAGEVSIRLRVAASLSDERVEKSGTLREAYNLLTRREARASGAMLDQVLRDVRGLPPIGAPNSEPDIDPDTVLSPAAPAWEPAAVTRTGTIIAETKPGPKKVAKPVERVLLHEDFRQWAPRYQGKPFNLIHCDFPYGVGLFSSNGQTSGEGRSQMGRDLGQVYSDRPEDYFSLLECLCGNLDRVMSQSAHLIFWYSEKHGPATREFFRAHAPSLRLHPFPLIWHKSDNAGISGDVRRDPRHIYETALFATRGSRQLVQIAADLYSCPTDKRFHVSAKPEPMLKHFFKMLVDEHTRMLDPTAGSGSSIRAAEAMGASEVLGMEIDEQTCGVARQALRQARTLRGIL